ncbi:hypothetical protein EVAR_47355_1 [Eumeta japonica]|uniref:Uncharacterized protein n=1 Tax=Eumeta variegata TaxID=151549 RepID=A0A4C1WSM1_EUMVA|nr:hypothetical protein EVAR_47355_1 [Eumeta japonica]
MRSLESHQDSGQPVKDFRSSFANRDSVLRESRSSITTFSAVTLDTDRTNSIPIFTVGGFSSVPLTVMVHDLAGYTRPNSESGAKPLGTAPRFQPGFAPPPGP